MNGQPGDFIIREAQPADLSGIAIVRTSVRENLLNPEQLAARGITLASVAASLAAECKGWVAVLDGRIVAFSIANRETASIFALFVLPDYESKGLGQRLLALAVQWLWDQGANRLWLSTAPGTRAAGFYRQAGWQGVAPGHDGQLRFELYRPG
jgi:GNAT superfamily N-acetyltransferase